MARHAWRTELLLFGALYPILCIAVRHHPRVTMQVLLDWAPPVTAVAVLVRAAFALGGHDRGPVRRAGRKPNGLQRLRKEGIPAAYLSRPEQAIRRWGEVEAVRAWWDRTERRFRNYDDGYPPDWSWRRRAVLERDHDRCRFCGCHPESPQVHHLVWLADGGTHSLNNLILLCSDCHAEEHGQERLRTAGRRRRA